VQPGSVASSGQEKNGGLSIITLWLAGPFHVNATRVPTEISTDFGTKAAPVYAVRPQRRWVMADKRQSIR